MAIPEYPISRVEHYLARANGKNVQPPDPISRIEHYLAGIAGGVPQELFDDVADLKSQINEKAPAIMQTLTDQAIASFADGADDMPLKSLIATINPVQAGTGDPSPENVRPITGWDAVTVTVNNNEQTVDLGKTVYGGTLDVVSGVLTVEWVGATVTQIGSDGWYIDSSGETTSGGTYARIRNRSLPIGINTPGDGDRNGIFSHGLWRRNTWEKAWRAYNTTLSGDQKPNIIIDSASDITTPEGCNAFLQTLTDPLQICYKLSTTVTYQLTPVEVKTLLGQNNISAETGNVSVVYPADTKTYIDNQIAALQALVLENISNS